MGRDGVLGNHGNKTHSGGPRPKIDCRKVPADSVPYGESISPNGKYVWAAYADDGALVCVAATAQEARSKYRLWTLRRAASDEG
jgi:hypothetical protein